MCYLSPAGEFFFGGGSLGGVLLFCFFLISCLCMGKTGRGRLCSVLPSFLYPESVLFLCFTFFFLERYFLLELFFSDVSLLQCFSFVLILVQNYEIMIDNKNTLDTV